MTKHSGTSRFSALDELNERRRIWKDKPQIRLVYRRWLEMMRPFIPAGPILDAGSGSGLLEELLPEAIRCDIIPAPWLNLVTDCMRLPLKDACLGAIVDFDFLHHVGNPHVFFQEAERALRPGGRVLLLEPYITPVSYVAYKLLHHEDVCFGGYYRDVLNGRKTDPWEGNMALPNIVFGREAKEWDRRHPSLKIVHKRFLSFIDFQFAAGFKPHAYLPMRLFQRMIRLDDLLPPLMPLIGFRVFIVLEKKGANA